jgi:hypothetical protein
MRASIRYWMIALSLLVIAGASTAFRPAEPLIDAPPMRLQSAEGRLATIAAMHEAWENRRTSTDREGEKAERAFLNRVATLVRSSRGREGYVEACQLWNVACREHAARFSDFPEVN